MAGRTRCIALTTFVTLIAAVPANAQVLEITNGSADSGLAGWTGSGVASIEYDANAIPRGPYQASEARLFAISDGGAIQQVIDLSGVTPSIDAGGQPLSAGGTFGGWAGQSGAARLVMQPLDASGAALGTPLIAGPPSDRDRQEQTKLLACHANGTAPVGTRSVLLRVDANGVGGLADTLHVQAMWPPEPALPYDPLLRIADTPGCRTDERLTSAVPAPAPPSQVAPQQQPTASLDARALFVIRAPKTRCSSTKLRFTIKPAMRARVKSFAVTARGRRIVRAAHRTIAIPMPRRRHILRVTLKATLRNGAQHSMTRRFRCG